MTHEQQLAYAAAYRAAHKEEISAKRKERYQQKKTEEFKNLPQ